MVNLHESGEGSTPLDIKSVRQLAISLGYTFEGEDDPEKKADLGGIAAFDAQCTFQNDTF